MASAEKLLRKGLMPGKLYRFLELFYCYLDNDVNIKRENDYFYLPELFDSNYWSINDIPTINKIEEDVTKLPCVYLGTKKISIQVTLYSKLEHRDFLCFLFCNKLILVELMLKSHCIAV